MRYTVPNNKKPAMNSLKELPAYGRRIEFWVKSHNVRIQKMTFKRIMATMLRCFIAIQFDYGGKNRHFFDKFRQK